ncbi:MAG TPA: preprotein translocase subunit SecG [Candidatus Aquilonibacter sp.]|nr:preprotein translocase subunit SecG [Candidatus Aquilonibacter sp.]
MILAAAAAAASAKPQIQVTTVPNPNPSPVTIQAPPVAVMQQTWFQAHVGWLTHTVAGIFIIAAVLLVVLLAMQTTKQEGLSGTIGGRVESAYARAGAEEQLKRVTGFTAVVFVLTAFILSLTGI